jgi:putative transcriptional regulator
MNYKMKAARVELGYSQADLAKILNVSRQTIILIEQDKFNPSLNLCRGICKALNRTLNDLFWEEDNE